MNRSNIWIKSGVSAFAMLCSAAAFAQAPQTRDAPTGDTLAGGNSLEEIVVTAQKREENLQRTPIAITAFTAASLERSGTANILDLNTRVPNVFIGGAGQAGRSAGAIFIRGIGVDAETLAKEPGVGVYIDDIYYSKQAGALLNLVDVDSIEVLRGPQGTLFGKNTIGGAIRYTTKKPQLGEVSGNTELNVGTYKRLDAKGSFNIPVGDYAALRISAGTNNQAGYVRALAGGDKLGDNHDTTVRGQFRVKTDRLDVNLSGDYNWSHSNGEPRSLEAAQELPGGFLTQYNNVVRGTGAVPVGQDRSIYAGIIDSRYVTGPYESYSTFIQNKSESWGVNLTLAYDLTDDLVLKSLTSYRRNKVSYRSDVDGTPFRESQVGVTGNYPAFSQELQFLGKAFDDRLNYIVGLYYFRETPRRVEDRQYHYEPAGNMQYDQVKTTSKAIFGQVNFNVTDEFKLTVGGRYSQDKKDATTTRTRVVLSAAGANSYFANTGIRLPVNSIVSLTANGKETYNDFSPRVSAQYQFTPTVMGYASASRGYRAGGFNNGINATSPNYGVLPFDNEKVWTYEAGTRTEFFDRRLRANISVFQSNYDNLQISATQGGLYLLIANVAKARLRGVEAEVSAVLFPGFTVGGTLGTLDAKYLEVGTATQTVTSINSSSPLAGAPKWTYSLDASYRIDLGDDSSVTTSIDWGYKGNVSTAANVATGYPIPHYGLLNGSIFYAPNKWLSIGLVGKNLTDKTYFFSGNRLNNSQAGNAGQIYKAVGRPREGYVSVRAKF